MNILQTQTQRKPLNTINLRPKYPKEGEGVPPRRREIHTALPADVNPAGWNNWGKTSSEATAFYAEPENTGTGSVNWKPEAEAATLP
jgi:hypothetical protein